jgi:hypothetical protein
MRAAESDIAQRLADYTAGYADARAEYRRWLSA